MWEGNGQQQGQRQPTGHLGTAGVPAARQPGAASVPPAGGLPWSDTMRAVADDELGADVAVPSGAPSDVLDAMTQRAYVRQLIREFLRAVPRAEPEVTLALVRADGTQHLLTRAQFSAAIDRLRPRQRQIVRLTIEERWPRQKVCEYLHHISIKTLERDQVEALDILAAL